jgi:hypothetical protein
MHLRNDKPLIEKHLFGIQNALFDLAVRADNKANEEGFSLNQNSCAT